MTTANAGPRPDLRGDCGDNSDLHRTCHEFRPSQAPGSSYLWRTTLTYPRLRAGPWPCLLPGFCALVHNTKIRKNPFFAGFAGTGGQAPAEQPESSLGSPITGYVRSGPAAHFVRHPCCFGSFRTRDGCRATTNRSTPWKGRPRRRPFGVHGGVCGDRGLT